MRDVSAGVVGGFVTATGSGMAFLDWLYFGRRFHADLPWLSSTGDKFIEHGHRLLGMLAGALTIALVVVALPGRTAALGSPLRHRAASWRDRSRQFSAGCASCSTSRVLALIHGCVGPLFFAAAAGMISALDDRAAGCRLEAMPSAKGTARINAMRRRRRRSSSGSPSSPPRLAYLQLVRRRRGARTAR